ncbi:hypothetical protein TRVL_05312 [Trypanosoma vivax]|nr:hypothetical protein TRVL_05312 [Trypanosoma vivax]
MNVCTSEPSFFRNKIQRLLAVTHFFSLVGAGLARSARYLVIERCAMAFVLLQSEYLSILRTSNMLSFARELTPPNVRRMLRSSPSLSLGLLRLLTRLSTVLFMITEEVAVLASRNIIPLSPTTYSRILKLVPVVFFYCNLLKTIMSAAVLKAIPRISFEATDTQSVMRKRRYMEHFFVFLESVVLMVYSTTLFPSSVPRLKHALLEEYWFERVYAVLASMCPSVLHVSPVTQGIIGLISTIPSYMMQS